MLLYSNSKYDSFFSQTIIVIEKKPCLLVLQSIAFNTSFHVGFHGTISFRCDTSVFCHQWSHLVVLAAASFQTDHHLLDLATEVGVEDGVDDRVHPAVAKRQDGAGRVGRVPHWVIIN